MFWADRVAKELKDRKLSLEWVDDMKTPSGRIHVGALRGVVIHDLAYKALLSQKVKAKYTYVFDNHDPMDALPVYLSQEKFEKYLGMPLYKIPSPVEGFESYARYYAQEFIDVFRAIGCNPKILWASDLYLSGKMNSLITKCLDKADVIRGIYEELYRKKLPNDWFPFQVFCPKCGKVSTTRANGWNGERVSFVCETERLKWTKGCGLKDSISPFSDKNGIAGKLPWKVEWACKWMVIGVTVEGAGKDHMSRGGSHDLASLVCKKVLNYPVPYPVGYEFFLVGGKKMSSSKGVGSSSAEMLDILPPEPLRFLMVKARLNQAINFDPSGDTIPKLFDEYQKAAEAYFNKTDKDLGRVFELSQVEGIKKPPKIRFSVLAQWVQMPNMEENIKKEGLEEWIKYARIWVEKYAPESEKFLVQKHLPSAAKKLSEKQKEFLQKIALELNKDWSPEEFQKKLYEWSKELALPSKEAFAAIYLTLLGKDHGPKAGWLILSLNKRFVKKRFMEIGKRLLIATRNKGKLKELSEFLLDLRVNLVSLSDLGITEDVEETGKTYKDNSKMKALFYAKKSGLPSIADDGGLEISALGGAPGLKSRRWLGYKASDEELADHMMKVSKELPNNNRKASFVVSISLALPDGRVWSELGKVDGIIAEKPYIKLLKGYPYRSFFYLPKIGKYYHENELLEQEQKLYNHRHIAIGKLKPIIKKVLGLK